MPAPPGRSQNVISRSQAPAIAVRRAWSTSEPRCADVTFGAAMALTVTIAAIQSSGRLFMKNSSSLRQPEQLRCVLLHDQRPHLVADADRLEVGHPFVGRDPR